MYIPSSSDDFVNSFNGMSSPREASGFESTKVFWNNCNVLMNYNPWLGPYSDFQIKAEPATGCLVITKSLCVSRIIGFMGAPLTELNGTVPYVRQVCERIFEETFNLQKLKAGVIEFPGVLEERLQKTAQVALEVFRGLDRMYMTYAKQYKQAYKVNPGFILLSGLKKEMEVNFNRLKSSGIKGNLRGPIIFDYIQYYENLHTLSLFDPEGTADYSSHQMKAEGMSLIYTSVKDPVNWVRKLTSLKDTVPVLKAVCDRAKEECRALVSLKPNEMIEDTFRNEIVDILDFIIPALRRIYETYWKRYCHDEPNHPGLVELKQLIESLEWSEELRVLLDPPPLIMEEVNTPEL